jgi:hypothetical protein
MTYDLDALATLFGVSRRTMQNKLPGLYAVGFPRKLPMSDKVWSAPQVDQWIGGGAAASAKAPGRPGNLADAMEAELAERMA